MIPTLTWANQLSVAVLTISFLINIGMFFLALIALSKTAAGKFMVLCSHSPNDVPPEPQQNVSIAAVRGAVRLSKGKFIYLLDSFTLINWKRSCITICVLRLLIFVCSLFVCPFYETLGIGGLKDTMLAA